MSYRERVARPGTAHLLRTAIQVTVFWTTFLWLLPAGIVRVEAALSWPPALVLPRQSLIGWALFGVASALGLWSAATVARRGDGTPLPIDATNLLVVDGPYAFVRNPMAVAGIAQGVGVAILRGSFLVFAYAIAGGIVWHVGIRPLEEGDLVRRFGDAYVRYRSAVPLWMPRWRPFRSAGS